MHLNGNWTYIYWNIVIIIHIVAIVTIANDLFDKFKCEFVLWIAAAVPPIAIWREFKYSNNQRMERWMEIILHLAWHLS